MPTAIKYSLMSRILMLRAWPILLVLAILTMSAVGRTTESKALLTSINGPSDLVWDGRGHLYLIEGETEKVLRINLETGTISHVAGSGETCCHKDGIRATAAALEYPRSLAVDSHGDLYIGEVGGYVRKVTISSGIITTVAGSGHPPSSNTGADEGRPALSAHFWTIDGLAFNIEDDMFIVDQTRSNVFRVDHRTQVITTEAGTGQKGYAGDGEPGIAATFRFPEGLAFNAAGDLLIADSGNCRVREIDRSTHIIRTIAITGPVKKNGECLYYDNAHPDPTPSYTVVDGDDNVYFAEGAFDIIQRVDSRTHAISTYAGSGEKGFSADNGPATKARLNNPSGLAVDAEGNLYIAEYVNNRIRRVDAKTHAITTIAGDGLPHRVDVVM